MWKKIYFKIKIVSPIMVKYSMCVYVHKYRDSLVEIA